MSWSCAELAKRCGGKLLGDGNTRLEGISTDSRSLRPGDLFVAIPGPNFDGHDFVDAAVERGAKALLVSRNGLDSHGVPAIRVADPVEALGALAREERAHFQGPVVAITGSNGKTSTKEMCAEILAAAGLRVRRTPGNLNNAIGLPLSILALQPDDEALVVELGMNREGEIDYLARIASPDVAAVTQVAPAHIGPVGSIEAIARAKGELFDHIRPQGTAVVNADDPEVVAQAARFAGEKLRFGIEAEAEFGAREIGVERSGTRFRLLAPEGDADVRLAVPGRHLVANALCAAASAWASGGLGSAPLPATRAGLERFAGVPGRLTLHEGPRGIALLDDSYNSNPASALASLRTLRELAGDARAIALLGDMFELGEAAPALHADVGRAAAELGIDALIAVGELSRHTAEAAREAGLPEVQEAPDAEAAARLLLELAEPGDAVLVKGSRGMRMERAVGRIAGGD